MKLNKYLWRLYSQSTSGKKSIALFENADGYFLAQKYCPMFVQYISKDWYNNWIENFYCYSVSEYEVPTSLDDARCLYEDLITSGLYIEGDYVIKHGDFKLMLDWIVPISFLLYKTFPDYFIPYLFLYRFFDLVHIADTFGIDLPPYSKRADLKCRCMYYWLLCEVLYNFRKMSRLTPQELCAFLYDFAPNVTEKAETDMPQPAQAWFIGGTIHDNDLKGDFTFWQANPDTRKGDILIHYETTPVSAITCLWIAQTDGIIDPLFHYYANTYVGGRIEIPHITLQELKDDAFFSTYPLVAKNFQGVNGYNAGYEVYSRLLELIEAKGFDISTLPRLYALETPKDIVIGLEKDVEDKLLTPLLNAMGWYEGRDFIKQLGIHAGRGHRIYPDFALHYSPKENEERAKVLIEAKLHMKNNVEIEKAFVQAKSYADLLHSSVIVLCDKLRILVYARHNDSFDRNRYMQFGWQDMENPDKFNQLKRMLE